MRTDAARAAIADAIQAGKAILKFVTPNDAGATGSHQAGYLLPKGAWQHFTIHAPIKGRLDKHEVRIEWQDGVTTDSVVTWYGQKTRSEYHLTRFGRGFPHRTPDSVGDLLVIVPFELSRWSVHLLQTEEDIEELQVALGVEVIDDFALYDHLAPRQAETENDCIEAQFDAFANSLREFPRGDDFSAAAVEALTKCVEGFRAKSPDERLVRAMTVEYALFRRVESQLCGMEISGPFSSIDDFIATAQTILQRRKSRAGRSLENHVAWILEAEGVPFEPRPKIAGRPDIIIPSTRAYDDSAYPLEKLFVVGIKTTCKDRWAQVRKEAPRVSQRFLLTTQKGIADGQLEEMAAGGITLVVPKELHSAYPRDRQRTLMSIGQFIEHVKTQIEN